VVVAIVALLTVLVPTSYVLMNATTQSGQARQKTTALDIAEQWIETLNNQGPPLISGTQLPNVGNAISEGSQTTSNGTYSVSAIFEWATINGTVDLCSSGTIPQVLELQVTVSWQDNNSITDTTLLNYPPASVPSYGFLAIQLEGDPSGVGNPEPADAAGVAWGGAGGRVTDVTVTASLAGTNYTTKPDANGCAFMELPPTSGTPYTVSVGPETLSTPFTLTGGIGASYQSVATTAAVTVDSVTTLGPYRYDEGSYINVAYPNTTAAERGISCPNAGQVQCIATGQAPNVASAPNTSPDAVASVLSGSSWTSGVLPGSVSQIESSACGSVCVGVGFGPNGGGGYQGVAVVESTSAPSGWTVATPAGVTNLTQVTCPSSSTCLAIGSGASSAVLLGGQISGSTVTWTPDTLPPGVTSLSQITCAGGTSCLAIGSNAAGPVVVAGTATGGAQTFVADTLPSGVTSLSQITCAGGTACLAIGSTSSAAVVVAGTDSPTTQTLVADPLPSGVASLSQLTCAGGTACLAIGTGSSGAVVVAGTDSPTTQSFVADTLPSGVASLSQLTCAGGTACLALGATGSGPTVIAGAVSAGPETFSSDSLPSVDFLSGLACFTSGSTVSCEAPGAGSSGAVVIADSDVTSGTDSWSSTAVSGPGGLHLANLPISVNSTDLSSSFVACAAGTCGSSIGPLFPFANGYSVGAGDCGGEVANGSALATTVPGATGGGAPNVTLPLGLLPIEVTTASGAPVAGATVTATVADPLAQDAPCNDGTVYSLPATGPDGMSELAAVYETYTVTVTSGSTHVSVTVQLTPNATTVTSQSPAIVTPLPQPVVVSL
jgi:hypothetical protein